MGKYLIGILMLAIACHMGLTACINQMEANADSNKDYIESRVVYSTGDDSKLEIIKLEQGDLILWHNYYGSDMEFIPNFRYAVCP